MILALASDTSELAAVLAHEIAHVTLRHARARTAEFVAVISDDHVQRAVGTEVFVREIASREHEHMGACVFISVDNKLAARDRAANELVERRLDNALGKVGASSGRLALRHHRPCWVGQRHITRKTRGNSHHQRAPLPQ